jgi:hypothetical protein
VRIPTSRSSISRIWIVFICLFVFALAGCSGEPSARELKNRQEFETLLTALAMKNTKQLDVAAKRIADRHDLGEMSDDGYNSLESLIQKARAGDWTGAETQAYEERERRPYFR